jgi:hypothetical protein
VFGKMVFAEIIAVGMTRTIDFKHGPIPFLWKISKKQTVRMLPYWSRAHILFRSMPGMRRYLMSLFSN